MNSLIAHCGSRACLDEPHFTDTAICHVLLQHHVVRVEVKLGIYRELRFALLVQIADLFPVLSLEYNGLFHDNHRDFMFRSNGHQFDAPDRRSHDMQHIWLFFVQHFMDVGVAFLNWDAITFAAGVEAFLIYIADSHKLPFLHVLVCVIVSAGAPTAAQECRSKHNILSFHSAISSKWRAVSRLRQGNIPLPLVAGTHTGSDDEEHR